ncbi:uncharacterized protein LOC144450124 [Glandiceps talaboti]
MSSNYDTARSDADDTSELTEGIAAERPEVVTDEKNGTGPMPSAADDDSNGESKCCWYALGKCMQADQCDPEHHHPHTVFPESSQWERHHMERLRFDCLSFNMELSPLKPMITAIRDWIVSLRRNVNEIFGENQETILEESPGLLTAMICTHEHIPSELISLVVNSQVQVHGDGFLHLLSAFTSQYNIQRNDVRILRHGAKNVCTGQSDMKSTLPHRRTLLTWIEMAKKYQSGQIKNCILVDFMVDMINSAAMETDCLVSVKVGESTSRKFTVCGNDITSKSNIEVFGINEECILQVVMETENEALNVAGISQSLPQLASQALAAAELSSFGNHDYKTVYQLLIQSVHCCHGNTNRLYIYLVRCHISCDTLTTMSMCPIPNPLKRSVILYEKVACESIYSKNTVEFLYFAVKSILLMFQKSCNGDI